MSDKQFSPEEISKALRGLQDLAKGHNSRGTSTTEVDSMRDAGAGAGSDAGSTQIHHTPSNSERGGWAGSTPAKSPENGATDAIDENGTDYNGGAEMVKSILRKISKGLPLTAKEAFLYGEIAKGGGEEDPHAAALARKEDDEEDSKKAKSEDDDKEEEVGKSLSEHAEAHEEVSKGFEMSSFLSGWADVQNNALNSAKSDIVKSLQKSLHEVTNRQESFNGELAKSVAALGEVLSLQAQRIEQLESTPARGPKHQNAQPVEKSFSPGGAPQQEQEQLSKSQVLDVMCDMVEKGQLSSTEVIKFESNSVLSPELEKRVRKHIQG